MAKAAARIEAAENKLTELIAVMTEFTDRADIQSLCAKYLATLSAGDEENRKQLSDLGCIQLLMTAMSGHMDNERLQFQAVRIQHTYIYLTQT